MDYKVITAASAEPIALAEARLQCKVDADDTSFDAVLTALITAAREFAEHYTGRALAEQTLEGAMDAFPACGGAFDLPLPPVASITSIKYTDENGIEITLDAGRYSLSTYDYSRTVALTFGNVWPTTQVIANAVRVRFVTGYGATGAGAEFAAIPKAVKAALLLHIETEFPNNPLSPAERERNEKARDALLDTVKIWGR